MQFQPPPPPTSSGSAPALMEYAMQHRALHQCRCWSATAGCLHLLLLLMFLLNVWSLLLQLVYNSLMISFHTFSSCQHIHTSHTWTHSCNYSLVINKLMKAFMANISCPTAVLPHLQTNATPIPNLLWLSWSPLHFSYATTPLQPNVVYPSSHPSLLHLCRASPSSSLPHSKQWASTCHWAVPGGLYVHFCVPLWVVQLIMVLGSHSSALLIYLSVRVVCVMWAEVPVMRAHTPAYTHTCVCMQVCVHACGVCVCVRVRTNDPPHTLHTGTTQVQWMNPAHCITLSMCTNIQPSVCCIKTQYCWLRSVLCCVICCIAHSHVRPWFEEAPTGVCYISLCDNDHLSIISIRMLIHDNNKFNLYMTSISVCTAQAGVP